MYFRNPALEFPKGILNMRLATLLMVAILTGCAAPEPGPTSGKARFAEYPNALIAAVKSACIGPSQTFSRPQHDMVECREYLPPEPTAAIILNFDGTAEDLPQLVIRFRTTQDDPGFLVQNDIYLNVPQKTGGTLKVKQTDAEFNRTLNALYERAGGVPEP